jgi:hypothetical protein
MKKLNLSLFSIFKTLRQTDTIKKTDILWNQNKNEYYLNKFERVEDTFL